MCTHAHKNTLSSDATAEQHTDLGLSDDHLNGLRFAHAARLAEKPQQIQVDACSRRAQIDFLLAELGLNCKDIILHGIQDGGRLWDSQITLDSTAVGFEVVCDIGELISIAL